MQLTMMQAKDYINAHPEHILQRDRSGKGFICPLCNNGSGSDGDGLRLNKKDGSGTHYKCFKCGFYGDMRELIAQMNGLEGGSSEAFKKALEVYGIELLPDKSYSELVVAGAKDEVREEAKSLADVIAQDVDTKEDAVEREAAIKSYLRACHDDIFAGREYFDWRGINLATAAKRGVGYDKSKSAVVIPTTYADELSYTLRYTAPGMNIRYQNAEGGTVGLFNEAAIKYNSPLFVVEGAFDALSIMQVGFDAIALNSGSNAEKFIELVKSRSYKDDFPAQILIAMDNDEAGRGYAQTLYNGLVEVLKEHFDRDKRVRIVDIAGGCKDANELLQTNPERLRTNLNRAVYPKVAEEVDAHKVGSLLPSFKAYIEDGANNRSIPTGFKSFDKAIGGGLFPRLYMIGAISSLGKTTFCLQVADMIAAQGHDVIIFSLEMAKEDIIARSISRHTLLIAQERGNERLAKTELGIEAYERYAGYSQDEKAVIGEAYKAYGAYADEHISIYEGKHTAEEIRNVVDNYIKFTGHRPTVFIDYLQIVQPSEKLRRATVREQVDDAIEVFTAMRREMKVPVVVVSSFNRNSYNTVADNASFKESGTIEYSADCVITLELDVKRSEKAGAAGATNGAKTDTLDAMRGVDGKREIKLTFQKNRGNRVGSTVYYLYDARFNYFKEDESKIPQL